MILGRFAVRTFSGPHLCVDGGRWVLSLDLADKTADGERGKRFGLFEQRRLLSDGRWHDCGGYFAAYWGLWFGLGRRSYTYDGDHEQLRLGPISIEWCRS